MCKQQNIAKISRSTVGALACLVPTCRDVWHHAKLGGREEGGSHGSQVFFNPASVHHESVTVAGHALSGFALLRSIIESCQGSCADTARSKYN